MLLGKTALDKDKKVKQYRRTNSFEIWYCYQNLQRTCLKKKIKQQTDAFLP